MRKHNSQKFHSYNMDYQSYTKMKSLCGKNKYAVVEANKLSTLLPKSFVSKSSTVLIMEKEISGSSVFLANFNRRDINSSGSYIDQHPYIIAYNHTDSSCKGGFVDHGNWTDRSVEYTDPTLWALVSGSGLLECLPIIQFPDKQSGDISELNLVSHKQAFNTSFRLLEHEPE